jgi:hypothetical protein
MRGTADRFALTFWTDVFSCHCEDQGILPFDSKPPGLRRERGRAGSESVRDVERGFPAFVAQVNESLLLRNPRGRCPRHYPVRRLTSRSAPVKTIVRVLTT